MASRLGRIAFVLSLAAVSLAGCGTEEEPATEVAISYSAPLRLDPALALGRPEGEALWLVHTPLLSYRRAPEETGAELIPGLASDLPEVADGGRTYTLTLRDELEYSDETMVAPGDFERAIERLLRLGGAGAERFDAVVGALRYAKDAGAADIAGIESDPEERSITIRLRSPDPTFANALAMTAAAPVPATTPLHETREPPPGVGPYEIAELAPGEGFVLERSESFADLDIPDVPTGNIDRIAASVVPDVDRQTQDVLSNRLDYMYAEPAAALAAPIREQAPERRVEQPRTATSYAFLNSRVAPFDDPLVREAVNRAIDRTALARRLGARPGCAFLPPGVPGHDSSFDAGDDCPYGVPSEPPDLERARELISQAGAQGTAVTVWGDRGPGAPSARAYAEMLTAAGLFADPELLSPAHYRRVISAPGSRAQTGIVTVTAGVPNPLELLLPLTGQAREPDPGHVRDPQLNSLVRRLSREEPGEGSDEWEELDSYLVSPPKSYLAPIGHPIRASLFSERIDVEDAIYHPAYGNDYSSWSLEESE